ncbi:hypothetical protein PQR66_09510 [Paraburkholderia agricolaris]|jgi:hypothetical protein|uniref:Uncharacterized protein n=1 Tax=Paraburkholderia agricolaris TaxID=2152888 RepID=A0ABW8ZM71_9BURK
MAAVARMDVRKWALGGMSALSRSIIVWRQIMRGNWVDYYQARSVRLSAALFLATSFGAMLTEANVSGLAHNTMDELTTMAIYWGYALAPGMLMAAAYFVGILAKPLLSSTLVGLCLLCLYFIWLVHLGVSGWWVWVEYWPFSVVLLLFVMLVHLIRAWFKKVLR